jgi:hypothetical protein
LEGNQALAQERQELEAELYSVRIDDEGLAVRANELQTEIKQLQAEEIDLAAEEIQASQKERLAAVGSYVQAIADAYAEIVDGAQALAELRDRITETLGRPNHSLAKPVVEPLAASAGLFVDEVVFAATTDAARGSKMQSNPRRAVGDAWLE